MTMPPQIRNRSSAPGLSGSTLVCSISPRREQSGEHIPILLGRPDAQ